MHPQQLTRKFRTLAIYIMCAVAVAAAFTLIPFVRAADQPIDLDENAANGAESKVSTKVLQTYPVKIENTVYNNAAGGSYTFTWPGAGPGGFNSFLSAGPGVGTVWVWTTVYQVYSIESPVNFTPARTLSVFGTSTQGVQPTGTNTTGTFMVPGKSLNPTSVTLSSTSLSSSLITFFSPKKTVATCSVDCAQAQCDVTIANETGGAFLAKTQQLGCCNEPHQLICGGTCVSYQTDPSNCGGCGNVCASDEICSDGACICPGGQTQCGTGCKDLQTDPSNCGTCGSVCASDESCIDGACLCDPGLTQCGMGCTDLQTDETNCGTCGTVCASDEFCSGGACVCDPGLTQCGAGCTDLQTDPTNCGTCGTVCPVGGFCTGGGCACPAGQSECGGVCIDLQNDPLNCGSCGNQCEVNDICSAGTCTACKAPTATACGNQCVNTHTDPYNCGGCGNVCDFSGCPSTGQGTCSQGSSCVCSPSATSTSSSTTLRFKPVHKSTTTTLKTNASFEVRPTTSFRKPEIVSSSRKPAPTSSTTIANTLATGTTSATSSASVVEAPLCDLPPIEQLIPAGGTYTQTQTGSRFGKEIQTTVSITMDGDMVAEGPCPLIVPVTGVDTSGVILSPISVYSRDASGDGLCQPGEAFCNYLVNVADLGDTPCLGPLATLTSPPDQYNPNQIVFLNATSTYPDLPAYPGDGVPLDPKANTTAFSITTTSDQPPDVGRPFIMNVSCTNVPGIVSMPFTLGIGSTCNPATDIDGQTYDRVNGFQAPVKATLVVEGNPVNYSTGNYNDGSTIPFKVSLSCGTQVLTDAQINPNPEIVALVHETLGPQSLLGINGDNNANPDNPLFSCTSTGCDYQFRTANLPLGRYIISVRMPDSRIFQAGFTISP